MTCDTQIRMDPRVLEEQLCFEIAERIYRKIYTLRDEFLRLLQQMAAVRPKIRILQRRSEESEEDVQNDYLVDNLFDHMLDYPQH